MSVTRGSRWTATLFKKLLRKNSRFRVFAFRLAGIGIVACTRQLLIARRISIKSNAKGNHEDILRHLPVPTHLFVTLKSLNETESLADARKSDISRELLREMTALFLLVLFLAHLARKSVRDRRLENAFQMEC